MSEETIKVVVKRRREQGNQVLVLDLVRAGGGELPAFDAGAHVDLHLGDGLVRQYSLAGSPGDRRFYRLGILKDPNSRGGSLKAHELLHEGAEIRIGAPRNHFPLRMEAQRSVLVGGGIGITPMIAMAHALHDAGKAFDLYYCGRSSSTCAFLDELKASPFSDRVHLHFSDEAAGGRLDLAAAFGAVASDTHVYVCGPAGFMDWVIGEGGRLGFQPEQLHKELFQLDADTSGAAFDVVASKSGKTVRVEEGKSIVEALATVGIKVTVSCGQGVCGTCLCNVVEGVPDHRDGFLTDEEKADNDQILLCCSRSKSDTLVLDI